MKNRLVTKQDRKEARKGWINGRNTEKYKDLEILRKNAPYIALTIWKGTSGNPFVNYSYKSIEQRENDILFYKKRADERALYVEKRKSEKKEPVKHNLKVGNMFYTSWGYDQTNYEYIVIIEISKTGKTVKCQRTFSLHHGSSCQSNLQEPIFCPFGDVFILQVRKGYKEGDINLVGSYPFCHDGTGSRRKGYFSQVEEGRIYHETMAEFGH